MTKSSLLALELDGCVSFVGFRRDKGYCYRRYLASQLCSACEAVRNVLIVVILCCLCYVKHLVDDMILLIVC